MNCIAKYALAGGIWIAACVTTASGETVLRVASRTTVVPIDADRDMMLSLSLIDGDIEIVAEDRENIEVTINDFEPDEWDSNQARIRYDQETGNVIVDLDRELNESDVVVRLPRQVSLKLKTTDGDIHIVGTRSSIDVRSADGDIEMRDVSGGVAASAVDGSIRLEFARSATIAQPVSLATQDGDIRLLLPKEANADVSISSVDGHFQSDFAISLKKNPKTNRSISLGGGSGIRIDGQLGDGGTLIALKTIDGDVELRAID